MAAIRHRCIHSVTPRCNRGNGKPKRQRCGGCGGGFVVETGMFGVFDWRGDGRYRAEDAHGLYCRESAAERATVGHPDRVVRFIVDAVL